MLPSVCRKVDSRHHGSPWRQRLRGFAGSHHQYGRCPGTSSHLSSSPRCSLGSKNSGRSYSSHDIRGRMATMKLSLISRSRRAHQCEYLETKFHKTLHDLNVVFSRKNTTIDVQGLPRSDAEGTSGTLVDAEGPSRQGRRKAHRGRRHQSRRTCETRHVPCWKETTPSHHERND